MLNEKHRPKFSLIGFKRAIFKLLKTIQNDYFGTTNGKPCPTY